MTEYTDRRIVVLLVDDATLANQAAQQVDGEGGGRTFSDATPASGVRWCNWAMKPSELAALRDEFNQRGLAHRIEIVPDASGDFHPEVRASVLIFDTAEWEPVEVLAVLAATDPVIAQAVPEGAVDGVVL